MVIDKTITDGEVRDLLYRELLKSDEQGNLLNPTAVSEAIDSLIALAQENQNNPEVLAFCAGVVALLSWNLGAHANPANKMSMLSLARDSIMLTPNQPGNLALKLLILEANPVEMRKGVVM